MGTRVHGAVVAACMRALCDLNIVLLVHDADPLEVI